MRVGGCLGDSVRDIGDGLIDKSHVLANVLVVVGVKAACAPAAFGASPLVRAPYVFASDVVCNESFGLLLFDCAATLPGRLDNPDEADCP